MGLQVVDDGAVDLPSEECFRYNGQFNAASLVWSVLDDPYTGSFSIIGTRPSSAKVGSSANRLTKTLAVCMLNVSSWVLLAWK